MAGERPSYATACCAYLEVSHNLLKLLYSQDLLKLLYSQDLLKLLCSQDLLKLLYVLCIPGGKHYYYH